VLYDADPGQVLYWINLNCNERAILALIPNIVLHDEYVSSQQGQFRHVEAGSMAYGAEYRFNNHKWSQKDMPSEIIDLKDLTEQITSATFDIALIRICEKRKIQ
jgi:hypothetical protein